MERKVKHFEQKRDFLWRTPTQQGVRDIFFVAPGKIPVQRLWFYCKRRFLFKFQIYDDTFLLSLKENLNWVTRFSKFFGAGSNR